MENRRFERVGFQTEAIINYGGYAFKGEVENLSLKGLFVKTSHKIGINEKVEITIYFHGISAELSFSLEATVVRITDSGIGFSFQKIDMDSLMLLGNDEAADEIHATVDPLEGKAFTS